jgi:hypothetical protein
MPCVGRFLVQLLTTMTDGVGSPSTVHAESIPLYLPSSLPQCLRQSLELSVVAKKECRPRVAQADDALADIRRQHHVISGLWQFKKLNVDGTGNKACTQMRVLYNRFSLRTKRCAGHYRAARNALVGLDLNGSWQSHLQVLKDADIRGPGKDDNGVGNGRFEPSWIWLVPRVNSAPDMEASEQVLDDSLQVEWSKTQARMHQWEEKVVLVQEEMRRVIAYHEWKASWWQSQAARRSEGDDAMLHGIAAYAKKQAYLSECLARQSAVFWLPVLKENGICPEWGEQYPTAMAAAPIQQVVFSAICGYQDGDSDVDNDGSLEQDEQWNGDNSDYDIDDLFIDD